MIFTTDPQVTASSLPASLHRRRPERMYRQSRNDFIAKKTKTPQWLTGLEGTNRVDIIVSYSPEPKRENKLIVGLHSNQLGFFC